MHRTASDPSPDSPSAGKESGASDDYRIAILGGGHLGRAFVAGLIRSGMEAYRIRIGEPDATRQLSLERDYGVVALADNRDVVEQADVVLVAVRPTALAAVLPPLQGSWGTRRRLLVSLAAGAMITHLRQWIPGSVTVARAMPNLAVELGQGVIALYIPDPVAEVDRMLLEGLFGRLGRLFWLREESLLNVVTALSGSGPAYFFYFMEQLETAAHALGMERDMARALILGTGAGSMALAQEAKGAFQTLREQVTSPGGTTAAALTHLAQPDFSDSIVAAVRAAYERTRDLVDPQSETNP